MQERTPEQRGHRQQRSQLHLLCPVPSIHESRADRLLLLRMCCSFPLPPVGLLSSQVALPVTQLPVGSMVLVQLPLMDHSGSIDPCIKERSLRSHGLFSAEALASFLLSSSMCPAFSYLRSYDALCPVARPRPPYFMLSSSPVMWVGKAHSDFTGPLR